MNSAFSQLPIENRNPVNGLRRSTVNCYLGGSCIILFLLVVTLTPDSNRWLAVVMSMSMLTVAILTLVNTALTQSDEEVERLRYKLKLTETKLDRLKIKYNDACQLDDLTNCANRQHFFDQCQRFISLSSRSGISFSVVTIQIDQFMEILSHFGQRGSNELLRIFANVLHTAVREVDLVARIEDEKFALLLSGSVGDDAFSVTNRIIALARQIRPSEEEDQTITVSMGVVAYQDQDDVKSLVDRANAALNAAIKQGGDRVAAYRNTPEGNIAAQLTG